MKHLDLFSGIGGFAYAAQQVWGADYECVGFVEIDPYCQAVLKKRFPGVPIYGDIREVQDIRNTVPKGIHLITGGFPCQPFSQAGKRKGTADNRYLWPEMLRVIRETNPRWVIAENVPGIVNIKSMEQQQSEFDMDCETIDDRIGTEYSTAFIQILDDLEQSGYAVQTFCIPACAKNAPHRRDRIWIVGHTSNNGFHRCTKSIRNQSEKSEVRSILSRQDATNSTNTGLERSLWEEQQGNRGRSFPQNRRKQETWDCNWLEVATCLCGVDDGLPSRMDGLELSKSRHRVERLKALGNAIVPQVVMQIMQAIKENDDGTNRRGNQETIRVDEPDVCDAESNKEEQ